ncbi:hypothetical protein K9M50_01390 [Patescibacteria group bacterium]|nr:hypothetical protein [Patescibacteria group bacterium]
MNKVLFSEKQSTKPTWVWLIFWVLLAIFIYTLVMQEFLNKPVGDEPASATVMWLNGGLLFLVFLLIKNMLLKVEIRDDGIYYKYSPIHRKWRLIPYSEIKSAYIRKYKALSEYGGYGVRFGVGGKGRALNVRGNMGLQLEFNDKKSKLLLGTQKPKELKEALKQKISLKEISADTSNTNEGKDKEDSQEKELKEYSDKKIDNTNKDNIDKENN